MLVDDTMNRALAMGAKVTGKPARSWMGVPLLAQGEAIGALIIQDLENEHSFDEDDLQFMISVANQVAGVIYNIRVLDESKQTALQFETMPGFPGGPGGMPPFGAPAARTAEGEAEDLCGPTTSRRWRLCGT